MAKELLNNKSMEDIIIPLKVEKETASGALALVQYSRAQKQAVVWEFPRGKTCEIYGKATASSAVSLLQTSIVKHFDTMHRVVKVLVEENG